MVSANASFILFLEIGRIPRRDRSHSASRSVRFRVEIGPVPRRDRSPSAARLWCVRTPESGCVLRVWLSLMLHMGDQGFGGVRVGSCWNYGLFRRSWCMTVGLPCAVRGVCAHGSRTVAVTDGAVPHDSAVPTDAECTRMCNTRCPRSCEHRQGWPATVKPDSYDPQPRDIALRTGTTDLEPEMDRSRHGLRPISARVATDLGTGCYRSRRRDAENDGSPCKTVTVVRCFYPKGRRPDTNRTSSSVVVDIPCHRSTCVPHAH